MQHTIFRQCLSFNKSVYNIIYIFIFIKDLQFFVVKLSFSAATKMPKICGEGVVAKEENLFSIIKCVSMFNRIGKMVKNIKIDSTNTFNYRK